MRENSIINFSEFRGGVLRLDSEQLNFNNMEKFQIATSKDGWRKSNPILLDFQNKQECLNYLQILSDKLGVEVRGACVTGYERLYSRNNSGEFLGNGIYVHPKS